MNPPVSLNVTVMVLSDEDNDSLQDYWEIQHFGNLDQIATGDPDWDGENNASEYQLRTDPNTCNANIVCDFDGDGLPDLWEIHYWNNLDQGAQDDASDWDGVVNIDEYLQGTDPTVCSSGNCDSDGDGMADGWELHYFGALTQAAAGDADVDNITNLDEFNQGTDPTSCNRPGGCDVMNPGDATELCTDANPENCLDMSSANINPSDTTLTDAVMVPSIPADFNVGQNGTANYSINIDVPPGVNGTQPQLSLNYNHQGGNGLLGKGWSLGGLSAINRCNKNWVQDGALSGLNDEDDYALCLDGNRLIPMGNGEYRTANETYAKIIAQQDGKNPASFTVYHRDGSRATYGNSTDSYWVGNSPREHAFSWRIKTVTDLFGNPITYNYDNSPINGRFRISSITYGNGTVPMQVDFVFAARPDTRTVYGSGVERLQDERLSQINLVVGTANEVVRSYHLGYENEDNWDNAIDPAQISHLEWISLCEGALNNGTCQKTKFIWTPINASDYNTPQAQQWTTGWGQTDSFVDVNQDGLLDLVEQIYDPNAEPALSEDGKITGIKLASKATDGTISYAQQAGQWDIPVATPSSGEPANTDYYFNQMQDVNGDGYPDLVSMQDDYHPIYRSDTGKTYRGLHVAYSNGQNGFDAPIFLSNARALYGNKDWFPKEPQRSISLRDRDADGYLDVVRSGAKFVNVEDSAVEADDQKSWVHLDAVEIFPLLGSSLYVSPDHPSWKSYRGWYHSDDTVAIWRGMEQFADFNGDGYMDIMKNGWRLSAADGPIDIRFLGPTRLDGVLKVNWSVTPTAVNGADCRHHFIGDVNGDSLPDIVMDCNPGVEVILNRGDSGVHSTGWSSSTTASAGYFNYMDYNAPSRKNSMQLIDMNGDGLDDIVSWDVPTDILADLEVSPVYVQYSTGEGFTGPIQWVASIAIKYKPSARSNFNFPEVYAPRLIDINGDGRVDILPQHSDGATLPTVILNKTQQRHIQQFVQFKEAVADPALDTSNKLALRTVVDYENLTGKYHSEIRSNNNTSTYELADTKLNIPHAKYVVSSVARDTGLSGVESQNITTYQYENLKTHRLHGSLGFGRVTKKDEQRGFITVTDYSQDYEHSLVGSVIRTMSYAPNGEILSDSQNHYAVQCLNGVKADCYRNDQALDDFKYNTTGKPVPHIRSYLAENRSYQWVVNTEGSHRFVSSTRTITGPSTDTTCGAYEPQPAWNQTPVFDSTTTVFDAYGNSKGSRKIVCDGVNTNTYSISTTTNTYENHDTSGAYIVGLLSSSYTDVTVAGEGVASTEVDQSHLETFTYYDGLGTQPLGALKSNTTEQNSLLWLKTEVDYDTEGHVISSTESWDATTGSGGMSVSSRTTDFTYTYQVVNGVSVLDVVTTLPITNHYTTQRTDLRYGREDSAQDVFGLQAVNSYDDYGRLIGVTTYDANVANPLNTTTDYRLCNNCPVANAVSYTHSKADGSAPVTVYHDLLGREVGGRSVDQNGADIYTQVIHNRYGLKEFVHLPNKGSVGLLKAETVYDDFDRILTVINPDGSTKQNTYNAMTVVKQNENQQTQTETSNALGFLIRVKDHLDSVITYDYDARGLLRSTTTLGYDGRSTTSDIHYDDRGNRISLQDPNTGLWTYAYNALGLMHLQTDAVGNTVSTTYDVLGRIATRTDTGINSHYASGSANFIYDENQNLGKLTRITGNGIGLDTGTYEKTFHYTDYGLVSGATENGHHIDSVYDTFNRPLATIYPNLPGINTNQRLVVQAHYNNWGYAQRTSNPVSGLDYWTAGNTNGQGALTDYTYGNQVKTTLDYNLQTGRLNSSHLNRNGSANFLEQGFAFDDLGNLTARSLAFNTTLYVAGMVAVDLREEFCYDNLARLTHAALTTGVNCQAAKQFDYDSLGNLTQKDGMNHEYGAQYAGLNGFTAPNQVTQVSELNGAKLRRYGYDAVGNLLRMELTENQTTQQIQTNTWTAFGKPWKMERENNRTEISYGPERARVGRHDRFYDKNNLLTITDTTYVGGIFEIVTTDVNGVRKADEYRHYIGQFAIHTFKSGDGNEINYRHHDHIGSLVAETQQIDSTETFNQDSVKMYSFDAWGKRRDEIDWLERDVATEGPFKAAHTDRGFTGHEMLDSVGLIHMNGRVYDPELGRFLSADPLIQTPKNTQSFNRYTYVWNNPLSLTDPTGYAAGTKKYTVTTAEEGDQVGVDKKGNYYLLKKDGRLLKVAAAKSQGSSEGSDSDSVSSTEPTAKKEKNVETAKQHGFGAEGPPGNQLGLGPNDLIATKGMTREEKKQYIKNKATGAAIGTALAPAAIVVANTAAEMGVVGIAKEVGAEVASEATGGLSDWFSFKGIGKKITKIKSLFTKGDVTKSGDDILRVVEPGKPQFQLKQGEEGLSVFDSNMVGAGDVLPSFREGSQTVSKSIKEITDCGLTCVRTPGDSSLPKILQDAHMEIRPGDGMTRKQFKKAIKLLEP